MIPNNCVITLQSYTDFTTGKKFILQECVTFKCDYVEALQHLTMSKTRVCLLISTDTHL